MLHTIQKELTQEGVLTTVVELQRLPDILQYYSLGYRLPLVVLPLAKPSIHEPDLAPSDFHLFLHLKKFLGGQHFDGDEVKTAVREWFTSQAGEFYNEGIERLVPRLDKCLNNGEDYAEKTRLVMADVRSTWAEWLLFLPEPRPIDDIFLQIYIPLDCEFLVAVPGNEGIIYLKEVYRIKKHFPLVIQTIGNWSLQMGLAWRTTGFYNRRKNLHGLGLRVVVSEFDLPTTLIRDDSGATVKISGFLGETWSELEKRLNFTSKYIETTEEDWSIKSDFGTWFGMIGVLARKEADAAIGGLTMYSSRLKVVDFLMPLMIDNEVRDTCVHPTSLMESGKEEQRDVVRFLTAEGIGREIHHRMSAGYGKHSMSCSHVLEWHKRFREGRVSLQDDARLGQAHRAIIPAVIAEVDGLIWGNRWNIVEELRCLVGISHSSVYIIATKNLLYRKICAQWVRISQEMTPRSWPCRIVYLTSYVLGYVLLAAYSAALVSFLTVQRDILPFTGFEGLLRDGTYKLGVTKGAEVSYFTVRSRENTLLRMESKNYVMRTLYRRLIQNKRESLHDNAMEGILRLCAEDKYALVTSDMWLMRIENGDVPCNIQKVPHTTIPGSVSMALSKRSPYKCLFNH
ncbi:hypothetical protein ANN_13990, partial [Periplaneta americana]